MLTKENSAHPERKNSPDQLAEVKQEEMRGTAPGLKRMFRHCDFMEHCKIGTATLSDQERNAMITNLASFAGGAKTIHALSAPNPGYTQEKIQQEINRFLKSEAEPITCQTICDGGFRCPKRASGECKANYPAELGRIPLSADILVNEIKKLPVTGSAVKDSQTAEKFVRDFLYNQDDTTAQAAITSEIRDHFKLTASTVKSLQSVLKESQKSYQASINNAESRPWYVRTDHGALQFLPGLLAENLAEKEPIFFAAGRYYKYEDGIYREMPEIEAQQIVKSNMLARETRMPQIADTEKQWRLLIQRDTHTLNKNPYIINVRNGLYNVVDDKLEPHAPDYYSTIQLNVSYDKTADCPKFKAFLERSMEGDMEQVALLQEMLGYFLIPVNYAQKCFIIVGAAGAGKSVLLNVLSDVLLGRQNVSNVSWQALNERFKTAELYGKLANIFSDLPTKNIDDNGIFKALVGEDDLTVERKHRDPFSFRSTARLLFSCNSIPQNCGDRSEGFYRRLIIIRFNRTVPEDRRDPNLLNKFRQEADGIFLFALEGLRRLMRNNCHFSVTQTNLDELQRYREESDSVLAFVRDCCELDQTYMKGSKDLYQEYASYCQECGMKPYALRNFVHQIIASFPQLSRGVDTSGKMRIIRGIKLK